MLDGTCMKRDVGLQPERTSMAWLRTQLLIFAIGVFLVKVGKDNELILILASGLLMSCNAVFLTYYINRRFKQGFNSEEAVSLYEYRIKLITTLIVSIGALMYGMSRLITLF